VVSRTDFRISRLPQAFSSLLRVLLARISPTQRLQLHPRFQWLESATTLVALASQPTLLEVDYKDSTPTRLQTLEHQLQEPKHQFQTQQLAELAPLTKTFRRDWQT